jgi:hypothetical protein
MRRPNIIIGIVVLVVCGTLAVMFWPEKQMPEPVYKGKKLSEWVRAVAIAEMGWSKEENEAIQAFGTNAVPFYLDWIGYEPSILKKIQIHLAVARLKIHLKWSREDEKGLRAWGAYLALGALREKAEPAIPHLIDYATRLPTRISQYYVLPRDPAFAIGGLASIGPPAVPAYLTLMTNANARVRELAVAHAQFGSTYILDQVRVSLKDPDFAVRVAATNSLKNYEGALRPVAERP